MTLANLWTPSSSNSSFSHAKQSRMSLSNRVSFSSSSPTTRNRGPSITVSPSCSAFLVISDALNGSGKVHQMKYPPAISLSALGMVTPRGTSSRFTAFMSMWYLRAYAGRSSWRICRSRAELESIWWMNEATSCDGQPPDREEPLSTNQSTPIVTVKNVHTSGKCHKQAFRYPRPNRSDNQGQWFYWNFHC